MGLSMPGLDDIRMRIVLEMGGFEAITALEKGLNATAGAAKNASEGLNATGASAQKNTGFFSRLEAAVRNTTTSYDRLYRSGFQLQLVGAQLANVGEKGLGVLEKSLTAWGDYEFMLNRAAGTLGIWNKTSTAAQVGQDALNDAVHRVANEVKLFPAEDIAKGLYFWGSTTGATIRTQKDLQAQMGNVSTVMKAAALTQTDYETAIKGVYSILTQYYHGALNKTSEVTTKLFEASQKTALEFPDLVNSFKMVGPVASAMHVPFDDMVVLMGRMGDAGIRGSQAGRAFRQMFIQMVRPTAAAKKALDAAFKSTQGLGKGFNALVFPNGKFVGTTKYIQMLELATSKMTDAEKNHFLATIGTANELPVLQSLIKQQHDIRLKNKNAIDLEKYSLKDSNAVFQKSWDLLSNSWKGVMEGFNRAVETVSHAIGQGLAQALTPVVEGLTKILGVVNEWMKKNPDMVKTIGIVVGIGAAILVVVGSVLGLVGSFLVLSAGIGTVAGIMGTVVVAALPVVAIIAGIIGVVAALYLLWTNNFMGIQQVTAKVFDMVKGAIGTVVDFVVGTVIPAVKRFAGEVQHYFEQNIQPTVERVMGALGHVLNDTIIPALRVLAGFIMTVVIPAIQALVPIVAGIGATVLGFAGDVLGKVLIPALMAVANFLIDNVGPAFTWLMGVIGGFIGWVTGTFIPAVQKAWSDLQTGVAALVAFLGQAWANLQAGVAAVMDFLQQLAAIGQQVFGILQSAVETAIGVITTVLKVVVVAAILPFFTVLKVIEVVAGIFIAAVQSVISFLVGPATAAFNFISGVVSTVFNAIKAVVTTIVGFIVGFISMELNGIKNIFTAIWGFIGPYVTGVLNAIKGVVSAVIGAITGTVSSGMHTTQSIFSTIWSAIEGIIRTAATIISGIVTGIVNTIVGIFRGAVGAVTGAVNGVMNGVTGAIRGVIGTVTNIGSQIVNGLINGIRDMTGKIVSFITGWVKAVLPGPIADALGIHSPSRVAAEQGRYFVLGLVQGIDGATPHAGAAIDRLTALMTTKVGDAGASLNSAFDGAGLNATANASLTTRNRREVVLRVEVVSPDGSVSSVKASELAGLIKGSDLVTAIEHAASLD